MVSLTVLFFWQGSVKLALRKHKNPPLIKGAFEVPPLSKGLPWRDSPPWRERSRRMPHREKPGLGQGIGGILGMRQFSS